MRPRLGPPLLLCILVVSTPAAADDPQPQPQPHSKTVWEKMQAGKDLIDSVPIAAAYDGVWSIIAHWSTLLTNRTWDAPYPGGIVGELSTRVLYGTSWTVMLSVESLALVVATGGTWEWMAEAKYRTDWMVTVDAPVCPRPGAYGGCGVGVADFAFLSFRPRGWKWWFEAGGGWIQQRILNDQFRTVVESSWVLTPISAMYEMKTDPQRDVSFRLLGGPGVYFGMHNGHMHETLHGRRAGYHSPWTEMYPLDAGIGPGGHIEARATFLRHFALEGDLVMAPFLLGGPTGERPSSDIAPLDFERDGASVWRKLAFGVSWVDPTWPIKPTLGAFGAELSDRPIGLAGHRGVILRIDVPLRPGLGE